MESLMSLSKKWSKIDFYYLAAELLKKYDLTDKFELQIDKNADPCILGTYIFPDNIIKINHFNILKHSREINVNPEIVLEAVLVHEIGHYISYIVKEEWKKYGDNSIENIIIREVNAFIYGFQYISSEAKAYYIENNANNQQYWASKLKQEEEVV